MKYSDLTFEQYLLGELSKDRMKEVKAYIEENPEAESRIERLKKSNEEILNILPPKVLADRIKRLQLLTGTGTKKEKETTSVRTPLLRRLGAPAAAAVIIAISAYLIVPIIPGTGIFTGTEEGIRLKGSGGISVYRKGKKEIERLKNLDPAKEGDLIQIAITPPKGRFAAVISIDGRSMVTVHYPLRGERAASITPGKRIVLKKSYELDDAPKFERFFLITSDREFDISQIQKKANEIASKPEGGKKGKLPLPKEFAQDAVILLKK